MSSSAYPRLNGHRLRVSNRTDLSECLLGTGIPFLGHEQQRLPQYTQTLAELAGQCMGIRRAGAAALDLAYVAAGRFDGFWETGLERWDMAAGALLIKEAGAGLYLTSMAQSVTWTMAKWYAAIRKCLSSCFLP